jgi:predicted ATPase/DNA-binding SARP family transcriptional activator
MADDCPPLLTLQLFGPFEARVQGAPLPRLRFRKGQWLLALLALRAGHEVERDWLAGLLWPDRTETPALTSLRNSLLSLRQALGPAACRLQAPTGSTLRLELATAEADVLAFDAAVVHGDSDAPGGSLEQAVALYRGPLLEGCTEAWAFEERQVREEACLAALETLAGRAMAQGDPETAERYLHRAVILDPLREPAQRARMQVLATRGSYAAALLAYRELRLRLHRELNAEPDPETRALFEQIRAEARGKADGAVAPSPHPSVSLSPLPEGTVTFLFTDIEGSTRLWEEHPEAMRTALARHHALLHDAIEAHAGVVFKSVDDQICAAFASAADALEAALAAQRALSGETRAQGDGETGGSGARPVSSLRVRMALHTGTVEARDGDYFGPPLSRARRLLDAGHGGQILLTTVTRELTGGYLPAGAGLRDLGFHRLRDLQPEPLFQLLHSDLPAAFPPLRSLEAFAHNLPAQWTRFIGREQAMAEVKRLLSASRLLTLTGAGGSGKTRLALQVAADLLEGYADGVWLVEVASLSDPALVPRTMAATLSLREDPTRSPTQMLLDYLRPRSLLLLLDNCEHLLTACAKLVEQLLRGCPHLRILATSREALGIMGEQTLLVPCLSVPDPAQLPALERLQQFEAVQLFADRAALTRPAFAVTPANAWAVAQVCHHLDGIPLAIELAARVKGLSVEQLAGRLDEMFRLLTGGSRTALPRQQTLRALIDWSYNLLSEAERALLRGLSVFAGGWTLEAAEAVCGGPVGSGQYAVGSGDRSLPPLAKACCLLPTEDVLGLLGQLVEKSLAQYEEPPGPGPQNAPSAPPAHAEHASGEGRYRLLETVRQYARERLFEGGEAGAVRGRHRDWCLSLAERAEPKLLGPEQDEWIERLEREQDNLRAALEWCVESEAAEAGLRLAGALWWFWQVRGCLSEGRERLEKLLALPGAQESTVARGNALQCAWMLAMNQDDDGAAWPLVEERLAIAHEVGDRLGVAGGLTGLVYLALRQGEYATARSLCEEALPIAAETGDRGQVATLLGVLGVVADAQGDLNAARSFSEESLAIWREWGDKWGIVGALNHLAGVVRTQGDHDEARALHQEALALARSLRSSGTIAECLEGLAAVAQAEGRSEQAAHLFGAARALWEAYGGAFVWQFRSADDDARVAAARAALGEEAFAAAWAEGRSMTIEQTLEYALAEAHLGRIAAVKPMARRPDREEK